MRASKIPMKVRDATMKPLRQSISRINRATEPTTSATKKSMNMNQQQLQLMMDSKISQSLKTLIRNVSELQGTRKFEHLIPKQNAPKPGNTATLRTMTAAREVNCKMASKKSEELKAEQTTLQHADQQDTTSLQSTADIVDRTPMQRLTEAVGALTASISEMIPLMNLQGKFLEGSKTYRLDNLLKVKGLPSNENGLKSYLFAFRDGFGKSSNVDKMRPVRNWATCDPQRLLHSSVLGTPQNRMFSTSSLLLQKKKDGKECKKKGGSLPCLQASGIVKQDKDKGNSKICEKFCMPCCPPARDPPECVVAQKKRECKKFRAPRPAYSECKKDPMKPIKPCECLIQRLPPCGMGESKSSKAC